VDGPGCDCSPAVTHSNSSNEQSRGSLHTGGLAQLLAPTTRQGPYSSAGNPNRANRLRSKKHVTCEIPDSVTSRTCNWKAR